MCIRDRSVIECERQGICVRFSVYDIVIGNSKTRHAAVSCCDIQHVIIIIAVSNVGFAETLMRPPQISRDLT